MEIFDYDNILLAAPQMPGGEPLECDAGVELGGTHASACRWYPPT